MNVITAQRTYATFDNAVSKLKKELGENFETARWLIAMSLDGKRFVPTLVGNDYIMFAHRGIMIVS